MAGESANYLGAEIGVLLMKMDLKQLIPEMQKWDGKLPKQALYQTEPHPEIPHTLYTTKWKKAIKK